MKKTIVSALCLLMAAALAACGGQEKTTANVGSINEQTESAPVTEKTNPPEESSAPVETEPAETEPAETEPAFDTDWASNEFEALIPELPFGGKGTWSASQESNSVYEITIIGLNTSAATNPSDSNEPDGADKIKLKAYLNTLPDYGFTVTETGDDYEWLVTDSAGNEIVFLCGDGGCIITIKAAQ